MTRRVQISFAGVTFSGIEHGPSHVTVPTPAFKKMLAAGRLRPRLNYDIEHDGNGAYDTYNQNVAAETFAREAMKRFEWLKRPWLLYLEPGRDGARPILHYCPHQNLSYSLTEAQS